MPAPSFYRVADPLQSRVVVQVGVMVIVFVSGQYVIVSLHFPHGSLYPH